MDNGKRFEQDFEKSCSSPFISVDRFYDQMSGFKAINTICDFVVYSFPYQYYFELKSYQGKKLYWAAIKDNQYNGLLKKSTLPGVHAGVLIEFNEHDKHYYVSIEAIECLKVAGEKGISLDWCEEHAIKLESTKKRTRFSFDIPKLLLKVCGASDGTYSNSEKPS